MRILNRALAMAAVVASAFWATTASADSLKPYKDDLFAYPGILSDQGSYKVVDYSEARDINGRDEVPERRVRAKYVSLGVRKVQKDLALKTDDGATIRHFAVGRTEGARFIVLYLHGQGGSRKQGVDDFTFGGNFNRIKNIAAANDGLYLTPDFPDFGKGGVRTVSALIGYYAARSPGSPVIVACGSMGGQICWGLASSTVGERLSGLLLLGSLWDDGFRSSPAFGRRVPVFFGHGSKDTVFPVEKQEAFFRSLGANYPARFVRFETGTHGTPIRMSDWREVLDWMLALAR